MRVYERGIFTKAVALMVFLGGLSCSGCSFHSKQLDGLKNLFKPSDSVEGIGWLLSGPAGNATVYPLQVGNVILFTDGEDILLAFDGWRFTKIKGYTGVNTASLRGDSIVVEFDYLGIENSAGDFSFDGLFPSTEENKVTYRVDCSDWRRETIAGGELISQSCFFDSQETFVNMIRLDQSGNIRSLESVLGPGGLGFSITEQN